MNILIFGAHPDDVEIGMGGTIAKYVDSGQNVLTVVVTVPYSKKERIEEAKTAAGILGCDVKILDFSSNDMTQPRLLVKEFDRIIDSFNPDIVYGHWNHDSHQDHVSVANSVIASTRKNRCSVYMYEQTIPGGIVPFGFKAQAFVDITDFIDKKIDSTKAHKTPIGIGMEDHIKGIFGRANYRGFQIGVEYAEAFEIVKQIKNI